MSLFEDIRDVLELEKNNIIGVPESEAVRGVQKTVGQFVKKAGLPDEIARRYIAFVEDEGLLYSSESYRDHFFHPFHVFLLGFRLLRELRLELSQWAISPFPLDDDFLKKWLLTSLWHDITYAAAKGPEWLSAFIQKRIEVLISVSQDWSPLMEKEDVISALESQASTFFDFDSNTDKTARKLTFQSWLNKQLLIWKDHGVLSAVVLLLDSKNWQQKLDDKMVNECALAIALHNYHIALSGERERGSTDDERPATKLGSLNIEDYQLAYLLAYCDTAQEWGRPSIRRTNLNITYDGVKVDKKNKNLQIFLEYDVTNGTDDTVRGEERKRIEKLQEGWVCNQWIYTIVQHIVKYIGEREVTMDKPHCGVCKIPEEIVATPPRNGFE